MMGVIRFLCNFVGAILVVAFLTFCFLSATMGAYDCQPDEGYSAPFGMVCGAAVIGPIGLLMGRVTMWHVPELFGLLVVCGRLVYAGGKPRPPKSDALGSSGYPVATLTHISPVMPG